MVDEKAPRWNDEPPPGFKPDGTSLIGEPGQVKEPDLKIKVGDKLYSPEEFDALLTDDDKGIEDDDDLSDLDDLADL